MSGRYLGFDFPIRIITRKDESARSQPMDMIKSSRLSLCQCACLQRSSRGKVRSNVRWFGIPDNLLICNNGYGSCSLHLQHSESLSVCAFGGLGLRLLSFILTLYLFFSLPVLLSSSVHLGSSHLLHDADVSRTLKDRRTPSKLVFLHGVSSQTRPT